MPFFRKARARASGGELRKTSYTSCLVSIPPNFLASPPPSTHPPVTYTKIDFGNSPIPENRNYYAVVLDNVLSPSECQELIYLAELSAGARTDDLAPHSEGGRPEKGGRKEKVVNGWLPALLNGGEGYEFSDTETRNSDRIIWDSADVAARIWSRCLLALRLRQDLEIIDGEGQRSILGRMAVTSAYRWKVTRLNGRLRFLRYGAGQYFRPHFDGFYETPDRKERSFFTLHLYLNDSVQAKTNSKAMIAGETKASDSPAVLPKGPSSSSFPTCTGGATTFHSPDQERRLDVDPVAGRVLIFQHSRLQHSGDDVIEGTKYTLRSDIMYERA